MRLRKRIFLSYLVVAVIAATAVGALLYDTVTEEAREGVEARLRSGVRGLATELVAPHAPADTAALDPYVDRLADATDLRITIVARGGRVLADSEFDGAELAALDDHAGRAEVRDARRAGESGSVRYSRSIGADLVYRATRLDAGPWAGSVARVAVPLTRVEAARGAALRELGVALLAALVLALVAGAILTRRLVRPIEELARAAERLVEGDLDARARLRTGDELEEVSRAFDAAADRLAARIAEATAERDRLEGVLDGMAEGVVVTDGSGRIHIANAALHHLFGLEQAVVDRTVMEGIRDAEFAAAMREAAVEPGTPVTRELTPTYPERRTLQLHAVGLATGGAVGVVHDVTGLKRLEEVQRDFVANVSHELKTPLTTVAAYAESLAEADLEPDEMRESAEVIRRHVERLHELVRDLLELSRLEAEGFVPTRERVSLEAIFADLADVWSDRLEAQGLELETHGGDVETVEADPRLLRQALGNLVENVWRHAREGSRVRLSARYVDGDVELAVSDDGPGIPRDDLPRLFDRFYRVEKGRTRNGGGTGLGLAIVRHVAELHGGGVEVESEIGGGSTFRIRLPSS